LRGGTQGRAFRSRDRERAEEARGWPTYLVRQAGK
jgi:hypothetical protein